MSLKSVFAECEAEMSKKIPLLAIVGPTASGKTALSIALAQKYNGEIVSCDSMQIYKEMTIATAKPTKDEMQGIPHHLIDFLPVSQSFSVSDYVSLAKKVICDIYSANKLPILVGGTGLYYSSLVNNITFSDEKNDPQLREQLNKRYLEEGGEVLLKELAEFDPETAQRLHKNNGKRIIRAIEIYKNTGVTMSEQIKRSKQSPSDYNLLAVGITFEDRQKLYDRINLRVDMMLNDGLVDEARQFYSLNKGKTAGAAIGIKELKPYLDGECELNDAVEKLKMETRRYAKRQLTWFRRDERIHFIKADKCDDLFQTAVEIIENNRNILFSK